MRLPRPTEPLTFAAPELSAASGSPPPSRLSDYRQWIPLTRPPAAIESSAISRLPDIAKLGANWHLDAICLDVASCRGSTKALLDDGDLPPEWCYLSLSFAEAILRLPSPEGTEAIIHVPDKELTIPLTVADLCGELGGDAWRTDGALFVLWGARQGREHRRRFPAECEGILFPVLDGLGLSWATNADVARRIGLPIDD